MAVYCLCSASKQQSQSCYVSFVSHTHTPAREHQVATSLTLQHSLMRRHFAGFAHSLSGQVSPRLAPVDNLSCLRCSYCELVSLQSGLHRTMSMLVRKGTIIHKKKRVPSGQRRRAPSLGQIRYPQCHVSLHQDQRTAGCTAPRASPKSPRSPGQYSMVFSYAADQRSSLSGGRPSLYDALIQLKVRFTVADVSGKGPGSLFAEKLTLNSRSDLHTCCS